MRKKPEHGLFLCTDLETAKAVSSWMCNKHSGTVNIDDDLTESREILIDYGGSLLGAWNRVVIQTTLETVRFWPHQLYTLMADLHRGLEIKNRPFVVLHSHPYPLGVPRVLAEEILYSLKDHWDEHLERESSTMRQWDMALSTLADCPYVEGTRHGGEN